MATRTKEPQAPIADVTFTPQALKALLEKVVEDTTNKLKAEMQAAKPKTTDQSSKNEMATIKAFKKKGYGIVKPHADVLTFNRWIEQGLRPREGEHAVAVANLRLFHRDQCRPLTKEEAAGFEAKAKEKAAKSSAKVVPISTGAPL